MAAYTTAEILARASKLIPSEAVLDRSRFVDGDDLIDSLKERIARCVYSRAEAPYYFAYLAGIKIIEDLAAISTAMSDIDRCIPAMRVQEDVLFINKELIISEAEAALDAVSDTVTSARVAILTSKIQSSLQFSTKPVFGSTQAEPMLSAALATINNNLVSIRDRSFYMIRLLQRINAANLLIWPQRRQLRQLIKRLEAASDTESTAVLDLLIASSLLDISTISVDFSANKYYGPVTPGTPANRYTLGGPAPTGPLAIRKGDILHTGTPSTGFAINSYANGTLYLDTASGPGAVNAYITSSAVASYQTLVPALENAIELLNVAIDKDFTSKAGLVAYGNTGYGDYADAKIALATALASLQSALSAYTVPLVDEVKSLVESLREERLFSVLLLLENLDFEAISGVGADNISLATTAKDLLNQLAVQFGVEAPDVFMRDSDPLYDELIQRRIEQ